MGLREQQLGRVAEWAQSAHAGEFVRARNTYALPRTRTDLVDNCHLKVAYQNAVREGTVRLHGPYIVIVVGLAVVGHGELILVDLDEMRGLA